MLARAIRYGVVLAAIAAVFVLAYMIRPALEPARGVLGSLGGLPFFITFVLAIAVAHVIAPAWRPPWRGPAGSWRAPADLLGLVAALAIVGWLYHGRLEQFAEQGVHAPALTLAVACGVLIGPAVEEWLFRGYLWRAIADRDPASPALALLATLATAIPFACWHLPYNPQAPLVAHAEFGVAMAILRWRFASLAPGFALHAASNLLYFIGP